MGVRHENAILCDTKGVIYQGRTEGMNQWKSAHAVDTDARTLAEAIKGADVFFGLSAKGAVTPKWSSSMAPKPDHLRHGQPRSGDHAGRRRTPCAPTRSSRPGRSDYPNQVNNVLGFPTSSAARSTCAHRRSTRR
jgi:malate dehydrogenase (oxaloacetate-decarboxylating)(NADP+)